METILAFLHKCGLVERERRDGRLVYRLSNTGGDGGQLTLADALAPTS